MPAEHENCAKSPLAMNPFHEISVELGDNVNADFSRWMHGTNNQWICRAVVIIALSVLVEGGKGDA